MARRRPLLLDLFCGAGGAAVGYHRAGFEVVGVDIAPQSHYPFRFIQADALTFPLDGYDVIHASAPCKPFNMYGRNLGLAAAYPDLLTPTRDRLVGLPIPWVLENVPGAPLGPAIMLCGSMFGLNVRRHRLFEAPALAETVLFAPLACRHDGIPIGVFGNGTNQWYRHKTGRNAGVAERRAAMGIEWMTGAELSQAIPPAYTEWIGRQLYAVLDGRAA